MQADVLAEANSGSSDLSMVRSSPVWPLSVGCEHDAESVVLEVFEAVSKPADLLNDHVDRFGAAVGDPAGVEVRQDLLAPGAEGAAEPGDLGDRAGVEAVEHLLGDLSSLAGVAW